MDGAHDMGGMHGFGPVVREGDEPVFHEAWEGRIFALLSIMGQHSGLFDPGGFRFRIESIDPARYLSSSYYEKWMMVLEQALVEKGIVTADELVAAWQDAKAATAAARGERARSQRGKDA